MPACCPSKPPVHCPAGVLNAVHRGTAHQPLLAHLKGYLADEELVLVGGRVHHTTAQLDVAAARAAGAAAAVVRSVGRRHHHGRPAHHVHVLQLAAAAHEAMRHAGQRDARLDKGSEDEGAMG